MYDLIEAQRSRKLKDMTGAVYRPFNIHSSHIICPPVTKEKSNKGLVFFGDSINSVPIL